MFPIWNELTGKRFALLHESGRFMANNSTNLQHCCTDSVSVLIRLSSTVSINYLYQFWSATSMLHLKQNWISIPIFLISTNDVDAVVHMKISCHIWKKLKHLQFTCAFLPMQTFFTFAFKRWWLRRLRVPILNALSRTWPGFAKRGTLQISVACVWVPSAKLTPFSVKPNLIMHPVLTPLPSLDRLDMLCVPCSLSAASGNIPRDIPLKVLAKKCLMVYKWKNTWIWSILYFLQHWFLSLFRMMDRLRLLTTRKQKIQVSCASRYPKIDSYGVNRIATILAFEATISVIGGWNCFSSTEA